MPSGGDGGRWKDRRILAGVLGVVIFAIPVVGSFGVAVAFQHLVAPPTTVVFFGLWWLTTLGLCTLAFLGAERLARRMLPLAVLLKMGMAFPGGPQSLAVARRAASVRDLDRRVEEARTRGVADEPTVAAEKIVTLGASLSAHDRNTRGHAERVRALAEMIAEELHLHPSHRDRLRWSSLLHNIGKLAVHPDVLNKPGQLNDEEWEIIRRHPLEGARLTAPIAGWLRPWANTILEHDERFDGTGYPNGISGRQISLGGRIVAVADAYDVMTAVRSYKKPTSPDQRARASCAGTQFDPDIVWAFLAVSIWRLQIAAPPSWVGSVARPRSWGSRPRSGSVTGHSVVAGMAAGVGVLGLTAAAPIVSAASTAPVPTPGVLVQGQSDIESPSAGGGLSEPSWTTTTTRPSTTTRTTVPPPGAPSGLHATGVPARRGQPRGRAQLVGQPRAGAGLLQPCSASGFVAIAQVPAPHDQLRRHLGERPALDLHLGDPGQQFGGHGHGRAGERDHADAVCLEETVTPGPTGTTGRRVG
jgi:hypothetical protein